MSTKKKPEEKYGYGNSAIFIRFSPILYKNVTSQLSQSINQYSFKA